MNISIIRNKIMDLRDERIRMQREIATLEDLNFWAPWSFTRAQANHLADLKLQVQLIKIQEQSLRNTYIY